MKRLISLLSFCLLVVSTIDATTTTLPTSSSDDCSHDYVNGICKLCSAPNPVSTENGMYLIYNAGHLLSYAQKYRMDKEVRNADVRLMADIDLSTWCHHALAAEGQEERSWTPISCTWGGFGGTFDGNGHSISGLYINDTDGSSTQYGLYRSSYRASFKDLKISGDINVNVTKPATEIGMLVGYATASTFTNISASGYIDVENGQPTVGGIIGKADYDKVTHVVTGYAPKVVNVIQCQLKQCSNYVNVTVVGLGNAGGLVGSGSEMIMEQCSNSGYITAGADAGGIVGVLHNTTWEEIVVENKLCDLVNYATITSSSGRSSGGIFGYLHLSPSTIECSGLLNCGDVISSFKAFPICSPSNCFSSLDRIYYDNSKIVGRSTCDLMADYVGNPVTPEQLRSGEITYLLNDRKNTSEVAWRQRVDVEPGQNLPRLSGSIVSEVKYKNCQNQPINDLVFYSNDSKTIKIYKDSGHVYDENKGHCKYCSDLCVPKQDAEGYNLISHLDDLLWFRSQVKNGNVSFKARLTNDLDLGTMCGESIGKSWTPIESMSMVPFSGTFDGQGHTISGLYISNTSGSINGFFGDVSGTVCNLNVTGSISAGNYCGLIAARTTATSAKIENCKVHGQIICKGAYAGSIVGDSNGSISNCENKASVAGSQYVGGIVGRHTNGRLSRCINMGNVEANGALQASYAGGIAGYINASRQCFLLNSANLGNVKGHTCVGGLIGGVGGKTIVMDGTWFRGELVDASENDETVGLLIGAVDATTVSCDRCFYYYENGNTNYSSKYGSKAIYASFASGHIARELGWPWGQDIDYSTSNNESNPVLDGIPVSYDHYKGTVTNINIGLITYLINMAQKDGKCTLKEINDAVNRLIINRK